MIRLSTYALVCLLCFLGFLGLLFSSVLLPAQAQTQLPPTAAPGAALQCPAPALGPACGAEAQPWLLPLAGNPINFINGNKYTQHNDLLPLAQAPLLFIQRHYNSLAPHRSILGRGWSLHWDIRLHLPRQKILFADGRTMGFSRAQLQAVAPLAPLAPTQLTADLQPSANPSLGSWSRPSSSSATPAKKHYQLQLADHTTLWFDEQGYLIRWHNHKQGVLDIKRYSAQHPWLAKQIQFLQFGAHSLEFIYQQSGQPTQTNAVSGPVPPPLLTTIRGAFGQIDYHYELAQPFAEPRLVAVHYPDNRQLLYHYEQAEHPFALTGFSLKLPQPFALHTPLRMGYWWYDPQGRAIYSATANAQDWIRIDYHSPFASPSTAASPSLNPSPAGLQRTVYSARGQSDFQFAFIQQQWRLIGSQGVQCPGCPPTAFTYEQSQGSTLLSWPDVRWQHHHQGQHQGKRQLTLQHSPWGQLHLDFGPEGNLQAWSSDLTGHTQLQHQPKTNSLTINYANGDQGQLHWDNNGYPKRVDFVAARARSTHTDAGQAKVSVRFSGLGSTRLQIQHPHETQWWQLTPSRAPSARRAVRKLSTSVGPIHWHYEDRFEYDHKGRLLTHHLFEGGKLLYDYNQDGTLHTISWQPAQGPSQMLIKDHGDGRLEHHNGLIDDYRHTTDSQHLLIYAPDHLLALLSAQYAPPAAPRHPPTLVAHRQIWQLPPHTKTAAQNRPQTKEHSLQPSQAKQLELNHQHYLYDPKQRLVGAQQWTSTQPAQPSKPNHSQHHLAFWAWDVQGQNIAHSDFPPTEYQRDESGLIRWVQGGRHKQRRSLFYNSQRRLAAVYAGKQPLAYYQHDAFGYRIYAHYPRANAAQLTAQSSAAHSRHHFFIFAQQQLVAEWYGDDQELAQLTGPTRPHPIKRRYVYLGDQAIAMIDYSKPQATLYAIHNQFVGAPVLVTDQQQKIRWRATYQPLGAASIQQAELYFPLRLPGQYADPVTGWHDNLLRTYDPHLGHYLSPDPLGPVPGHQPLGYAQQKPWQFIDPLGLLLFAFDGTRYDARLKSNVWQFSQLYADTAYYQSGPGNPSYLDWDALTAWRANQIVTNQWQHLLNEILWSDPGQRLAIDVIGFSRGAALARHFGNQIIEASNNFWFNYQDDFGRQYQACIEPRFMGLFDTVAQFGLLGSHNRHYDLSIAPEWAWVAHAVALNEYRQLFPVYSIYEQEPNDAFGEAMPFNQPAPIRADNRVEAGFIGAHTDMGGGQDPTTSAAEQGDLAQITLAWMLWQAQEQALSFQADATTTIETPQNPIVHDARLPYLRYLNTDRHVQSTTDSTAQWLHPHIGQQVRQQVEAFIQRYDNWQSRSGQAVGTVDLPAYYQWLDKTLGWQPKQNTN